MMDYRIVRLPVLLCVLLAAACGLPSSPEEPSLKANAESASDIAMSLPALEAMELPEGTALIVPLDRNVLALDADTLASLASQGTLEGLLRDFVLEEPVTETDLVNGAVLRTVAGNDFPISINGKVTSLGESMLVDLRTHNGMTLLVVDSLFEP